MSQHDEEMEAILPVKQDLVPFEQTTLLAVRLPDDRVAALFSLLCESLQLDRAGQVRRIKADPAIANCLILARIETPGGPQNLNVLIAGAIPKWLSGIRLGKVAPELRPFLLTLQREAADVLYRHFFKIEADEKAAPSSNPSAEAPHSQRKMAHKAFERLRQAADTLQQAGDALQQAGDAVHGAADALREATDELDEIYMVAQEEKEAMGDHIVALEVKQKALEDRKAGSAARARKEPLPQDGPILTAEHRNQVYALARHLRAQTGEPLVAMFAELAEMFNVADMSDIPDAGWEEVAAWFWERRQRTVVTEQRQPRPEV